MFFQKTYLKIYVWCNISCALVLRSHLTRIASTKHPGIALMHYWDNMHTTGGKYAWDSTTHFTTSEIWVCGFSNLVKMSGFLTGHKLVYSLPPSLVMVIHYWKRIKLILRGAVGGMMTKREHRTSAQEMLYQKWIFEIRFLKKTCIFRSWISF